MKFVNESIPHKNVTIRPNDKPWYDSEIRKNSRKRDRLKSKAVKTALRSDWTKYKILRNKVNNLKRHAKETFYNNLEFSLLSNFSKNKKEFWKIIKHFTTKKDSVSSIPPLNTTTASGTHYSPKVLVIPRNRWLRLNMTEKLFTGTLNHNKNKTKKLIFYM